MIIEYVKDGSLIDYTYMNNFPDIFASEKDKLNNKEIIRSTADYFANYAYSSFIENDRRIGGNYKLLKGIISNKDFYREGSYIPELM